MILNGYTMSPGCTSLNSASRSATKSLVSACVPRFPAKAGLLLSVRSSGGPFLKSRSWFSSGNLGLQFQRPSFASNPLHVRDNGGFSRILPRQRRTCLCPQAAKDVPTSFRFPQMTVKPRWWWRSLACLPYLMPLHETWMYAETAYHLHPFLEQLEFLTYPFLESIGSLPSWFLMAYFFVAYLGIVRRKEWPHFFRFHVVMGMLLEIALQVIGTVSKWMPLAVYWGKIGMHFWTAVAFAYLFTVLECIRCALAGMYADVPFACDAAYIQIPYD